SRKTVNEALFEAYKDESEAGKLKALTKKQKGQISLITESENELQELKKKFLANLQKIFSELDIKIIEGYSVKRRRKHTENNLVSYKFDAIVNIKDHNILSTLTDFNAIIGIVEKVSKAGVTIKMIQGKDYLAEVFITKAEMDKKCKTEFKELFEVNDEVKIKYHGNKEAIVEISVERL
ncbi:MAG: hypothetical protein PHR06_13850, partial [Candidatus Cloacimonetes bacterium]|nr:hypothetical protein [Candidatus Cloacimonadota bacterium]